MRLHTHDQCLSVCACGRHEVNVSFQSLYCENSEALKDSQSNLLWLEPDLCLVSWTLTWNHNSKSCVERGSTRKIIWWAEARYKLQPFGNFCSNTAFVISRCFMAYTSPSLVALMCSHIFTIWLNTFWGFKFSQSFISLKTFQQVSDSNKSPPTRVAMNGNRYIDPSGIIWKMFGIFSWN